MRGEELAQANAPEPSCRHLRHEITGEHLGKAHVAREQAEQVLVQLAGAEELGGRDDHALLVELGGVRRHAARCAAAHVLVVAHRAGERHHAAVGEDRYRERDVRQVGAAVVGIVQQEGVAVLHAVRGKGPDDALRGELQRAEVDRDRGRLRDGLAAGVEERGRGVEPLLHDRRGRALEERQLHLVGDGVETVAQHLEEDRVDRHRSLRRRRLPASSTSAVTPGGITVVVSVCSTMAGPARRAPSGSRARS